MPQRALYELAEATLGLAPEMQWSVDEDIARRESRRLFERLATRSTTSEVALEVFVINMTTKLQSNVAVIEERYSRVVAALTHEQQDKCTALNEFLEFFTGMSQDANYSLNTDITRTEFEPLFRACAEGTLTAKACQDAVFDIRMAKRDTILQTLQVSVQHLNQQIAELTLTKAETDDA